ncbi:MAG: LamG-like jellyroll fold domain-containing protein [Sphingobacteriaceae bacterium]|nr:LamG-like jellyroll fold domain-containing protein [Sphingobacteriaceae bacterium]
MNKIILAAALLWAGTVQAQIPASVPTNGLVAYYGFEGNILDASGSNNHLTQSGTVTATTDRFGTPNSAYEFSTAGHLTNTAPSFTLNPTQSFSFSAWLYKTGGTVAIMTGLSTAGNFITLLQNSTTITSFGTNKQQSAWIWAQTPVVLNTWEHYVCVYNAPNMTLYKNGVAVATNVFTHTAVTSANLPLWIGRGINTGSNFIGKIDDVGWWNRALDSNEVQLLFTGCDAVIGQQPSNVQVQRNQNSSLVISGPGASATRQWQMNTGTGFAALSNGTRFSGVNSDTLRINNVDFDLNQASFRCIVASTNCGDTSTAVVLTVTCNAMLENNPVATSGRMNETASFSVTSYDSLAGFQWQVNSGSGFTNLTNGSDVSGATARVLQLSNLSLSQTGHSYRCLVLRTPCADTSVAAVLTVINTTSVAEQGLSPLKVYPNPATAAWNIDLPENSGPLTYQLLDLQGRVLQKGQFEAGNNLLSTEGLASGHYLLEVAKHAKMRLIKQ